MWIVNCPNCRREFQPMAREGEYCPECWKAWAKNDGSFAAREVNMKSILKEQLERDRLKPIPPSPQPREVGS